VLTCSESPITFRLKNPDPDALSWRVDNLAALGRNIVGGCGVHVVETAAEIEQAFERINNRIHGSPSILGPGEMTVSLVPDPGNVDPSPAMLLEIGITGTSSSRTTVLFQSFDASPAQEDVAPIHLNIDGNVSAVDLTDIDSFLGEINVDGFVRESIRTAGLLDGSTIRAQGSEYRPLEVESVGDFGDDVRLLVDGRLSRLDVAGDWRGGLLQVDQAGALIVRGDFGPRVDVNAGFESLSVLGGDFLSPNFASGVWPDGEFDLPGNGRRGSSRDGQLSGGFIHVAKANGVGGSLVGEIVLRGGIGQITADGGSIDAMMDINGNVGLIRASIDSNTKTGGNIAGDMEIDSLDRLTSIGGEITTSLATFDPDHVSLRVGAVEYQGYGGLIDSPNSFFIAGGVAEIRGNQLNLRVEADGAIDAIIAKAAADGTPALLSGRFTAAHFGRVEAKEANEADFELTATDPSWRRDGRPGWGRIDAPAGPWITQLELPPGVTPGELRIDGQPLDLNDESGLVIEGNRRVVIAREGLQYQVHVLPASWQNTANPYDVNDDGRVVPIDALIVINHLNRSGSGPIDPPTVGGPQPAPYYDVSGDGRLTPLDALRVINFLNRNAGGGEGEGGPTGSVPLAADPPERWRGVHAHALQAFLADEEEDEEFAWWD
jgi:hypothetical protein